MVDGYNLSLMTWIVAINAGVTFFALGMILLLAIVKRDK